MAKKKISPSKYRKQKEWSGTNLDPLNVDIPNFDERSAQDYLANVTDNYRKKFFKFKEKMDSKGGATLKEYNDFRRINNPTKDPKFFHAGRVASASPTVFSLDVNRDMSSAVDGNDVWNGAYLTFPMSKGPSRDISSETPGRSIANAPQPIDEESTTSGDKMWIHPERNWGMKGKKMMFGDRQIDRGIESSSTVIDGYKQYKDGTMKVNNYKLGCRSIKTYKNGVSSVGKYQVGTQSIQANQFPVNPDGSQQGTLMNQNKFKRDFKEWQPMDTPLIPPNGDMNKWKEEINYSPDGSEVHRLVKRQGGGFSGGDFSGGGVFGGGGDAGLSMTPGILRNGVQSIKKYQYGSQGIETEAPHLIQRENTPDGIGGYLQDTSDGAKVASATGSWEAGAAYTGLATGKRAFITEPKQNQKLKDIRASNLSTRKIRSDDPSALNQSMQGIYGGNEFNNPMYTVPSMGTAYAEDGIGEVGKYMVGVGAIGSSVLSSSAGSVGSSAMGSAGPSMGAVSDTGGLDLSGKGGGMKGMGEVLPMTLDLFGMRKDLIQPMSDTAMGYAQAEDGVDNIDGKDIELEVGEILINSKGEPVDISPYRTDVRKAQDGIKSVKNGLMGRSKYKKWKALGHKHSEVNPMTGGTGIRIFAPKGFGIISAKKTKDKNGNMTPLAEQYMNGSKEEKMRIRSMSPKDSPNGPVQKAALGLKDVIKDDKNDKDDKDKFVLSKVEAEPVSNEEALSMDATANDAMDRRMQTGKYYNTREDQFTDENEIRGRSNDEVIPGSVADPTYKYKPIDLGNPRTAEGIESTYPSRDIVNPYKPIELGKSRVAKGIESNYGDREIVNPFDDSTSSEPGTSRGNLSFGGVDPRTPFNATDAMFLGDYLGTLGQRSEKVARRFVNSKQYDPLDTTPERKKEAIQNANMFKYKDKDTHMATNQSIGLSRMGQTALQGAFGKINAQQMGLEDSANKFNIQNKIRDSYTNLNLANKYDDTDMRSDAARRNISRTSGASLMERAQFKEQMKYMKGREYNMSANDKMKLAIEAYKYGMTADEVQSVLGDGVDYGQLEKEYHGPGIKGRTYSDQKPSYRDTYGTTRAGDVFRDLRFNREIGPEGRKKLGEEKNRRSHVAFRKTRDAFKDVIDLTKGPEYEIMRNHRRENRRIKAESDARMDAFDREHNQGKYKVKKKR